jgi:leader peptidase (prepilin peptidase)/N-methyltransferase
MVQLQNLTSYDGPALVPFPLALIFASAIGALIGSFLNVVIHRVPREESIVLPSSRCPSCGTAIRPYDNVPILSYLVLRGRCRACGVSISARYPAIEALTALLFGLVFLHDGFVLALPFDLIFVAALVALVFIDAEHMILPDVITLPGLVFALLVRALVPNLYGLAFLSEGLLVGWPAWAVSLAGALFGAVIGGGSLWLMGWLWERFRGVEAMGLGDVKMMFMVGAYLGWPLTVLTIFLGVIGGSFVGVGLMLWRRERDMQMLLPFGIFLGLGAILSLLAGQQIVGWYVGHFLP